MSVENNNKSDLLINSPVKDDNRSLSTLELPTNSWNSNNKKGNRDSIFASPFASRKKPDVPLVDVPVITTDATVNDDVFKTEEEEDYKKLVDWATSVFIPACKSLLDQCSAETVINSKVQTYLRLLSNTIVFFCNEHSGIVSPSRSTSGLSEISSRESTPSRDTHLLSPGHHRGAPPTNKPETVASVSIKVLRAVSSSLIPPLLIKSSEEGFSDELHKEIVLAIQKISWKVEACLSYSNPNVEYSIHKRIFDGLHGTKVLSMMTVPPPEEYKVQNSPAHISKLATTRNTTPSPMRFHNSIGVSYPPPSKHINSKTSLVSPTHETEDDYFRPKAPRRTTVSISKLQVQNLGLNMADVATLDNYSVPRSNTIGISTVAKLVQDEGVMKLEAVRNKVLQKLAKEFPQLQTQDTSEEMPGTNLRPMYLPLNDTTEGDHANPSSYTSTPLTMSPVLSCAESPFLKESSSPPSGKFIYDQSEELPENTRLKARTRSLDFEHSNEISPSPTSPFLNSISVSSRLPEEGVQTLPKRRSTFLNKFIKSRSFGKADRAGRYTVGSSRTPRKKSSASEFFSFSSDNTERESPSIEIYSRNAHPSESSNRDSFYLNIEVLGKSVTSPRKRRFSMSGPKGSSRSSLIVEISVTTNSPEFELHEYTISRSFKDIIALYDILLSTIPSAGGELPDRPEKRSKDWRQQVENFLNEISKNSELRTLPEFLDFIKPGEMNAALIASTQNDSELELLMTFYTPLVYPTGEPGSHFEVEQVKSSIASTATTPSKGPRHYFNKSTVSIERQDGEEETTFIIRESDKDVLIVSETPNRCLIVAGTFEKLVEQLACEEKPDPHYVNTFLLGYRHFASSTDLISLLIKQFQMTTAPDAPEEEVAYAEKWRYVIQLRVLDILTYWIKSCFGDFLLNPKVLDYIKEFIEQLQQSDDNNFISAADQFSNLITKKTEDYYTKGRFSSRISSSSSRSPSTSPVHAPSYIRKTSTSDINAFTAIQLARQLTLMELDYLKSIDVFELAIYTWENNDETKPFRKNLDAYIARFNKVSYWVASEILLLEDEKMRANLIEKFIEIAKHCQELRNFNTTVSVVTGLSLSSIRRLEKTWKHVNEKLVKSFDKLRQLVNPGNNHSDYRKAVAVSLTKGSCIPYFGVFMRDVTLCNYGNPKKLRNGLYNFSKLRILVQMFEEIYQYQKSNHYFPSDDRTQIYCSNLHSLEEHDLYEMSLKLEPREPSVFCESD